MHTHTHSYTFTLTHTHTLIKQSKFIIMIFYLWHMEQRASTFEFTEIDFVLTKLNYL